MEIVINIPGIPVGKQRPRFARRGKFVKTYTPMRTAKYEETVVLYARQTMGRKEPLAGPLEVDIVFQMPVPLSWPNKKKADALAGGVYPTNKPDIDNMIKSVCDSLNGIAWGDDRQIILLIAFEEYSEQPCTRVRVREFDFNNLPDSLFT